MNSVTINYRHDQQLLNERIGDLKITAKSLIEHISESAVLADELDATTIEITTSSAFSILDMCGHFEAIDAAQSAPEFSADLPNKQCDWWWWNGDEDAQPILVSILFSGSNGEYFASMGQHGWTIAQFVETMGGQWMEAIIPNTPKQVA